MMYGIDFCCRQQSIALLNASQEGNPVFLKNYLELPEGDYILMQKAGYPLPLSFSVSWYRKKLAPSSLLDKQMIHSLQSLFAELDAQFLSYKSSPRVLVSKLYFRLQAGRELEKIEFILFLLLLFSRENVNISLDLKFDISMARSSSDPMMTRIFCFFNSATLEPSRKNRATEPSTAAIITIDKLSIIIIIKSQAIRVQIMNVDLEKKIQQHRQRKTMKKSFDETVEQKKRKLKGLRVEEGQQNESGISKISGVQLPRPSKKQTSADSFMDFKHRRYIQITKELMEAKSKLTEVSHQCEDIKTEVYFEEKKANDMKDFLRRQYEEEQQILEKKIQKFEHEKAEKIKMYEDRISKNMEHVEQLLKQKEEQNQRRLKFIERKKKFEQNKKKIKQKYEEQLKANKQKWAEEQKNKRQQWQKSKMEELESRTLRNLQPQIQRIVQRSKDEINKIRQKYEAMIEEFRKAANEQFEKSVKGFRQMQAAQLQQERNIIVEQNNKKLRDQAEHLQLQFEEERIRAKNDYNEEIKQLEHNRRVESQEYIRKNRYFYVENLEEIKKIKDEYEIKIQELDGILMKEVDERQAHLSERNRTKIESFKEDQRLKLKKRMEQYDKQIKSQIEANIEKVSSEIAVTHAVYERKVAKSSEQRIKQEKQNSQLEIKQIKKSVLAIENKIQNLKRQRDQLKDQRTDHEANFLQAKQENQLLRKKLLEITNEVEELKVSESSVEGRKNERKQQVENMWDRQIASIKQILDGVEQERKSSLEVMKERERQTMKETEEAIQEIQKHSNKIIKQKQVQQEGLLIKIEHQERQRQSLRSILKEQLQIMKNYNAK